MASDAQRRFADTSLEERAARAERHAEALRRVLDAGLVVGSEIALDLVLERIVEAGCELTGARFGALGVLDPDRDASCASL